MPATERVRDQIVLTARDAWWIDDVGRSVEGGAKALGLDRSVKHVTGSVWAVNGLSTTPSVALPVHEDPLPTLSPSAIPDTVVIACLAPAFIWRIHEIRASAAGRSRPEHRVAFVSRIRAIEWVERHRRVVRGSNWGIAAHPAVAVETTGGERWLCAAQVAHASTAVSLDRLAHRRRTWCSIRDLLAIRLVDLAGSFGLGTTGWPSAVPGKSVRGVRTEFGPHLEWRNWSPTVFDPAFDLGVRTVAVRSRCLMACSPISDPD